MFRVIPFGIALIVTLLFALSVSADNSQRDKLSVGAPHVTIPCNYSTVPYSVYAMPITHTETLTLTFQASGEGLISFNVNNYEQAVTPRTDATCGNCTLVVHDMPPGPLNTLQIMVTAAAAACPSGGMAVSNFVLQVSP